MSFNDSGLTEPATRNQSRRGNQRDTSYNRDEPVELWVNTVIVKEQGAEPIRLLSGRPLRAFNADKDVTTNNEDFNRANAVANAFVTMMMEDADQLQLGESRYYGPGGNSAGEDLAPGIYFQLHRTMADAAADAAVKADIEASERDSLRNLFG